MGQVAGKGFGIRKQLLQQERGLRALKGKNGVLPCQIRDLDVVGDEIVIQVREDLFLERLPQLQEEGVVQAKEPGISEDFPLNIQDRRIYNLTRLALFFLRLYCNSFLQYT